MILYNCVFTDKVIGQHNKSAGKPLFIVVSKHIQYYYFVTLLHKIRFFASELLLQKRRIKLQASPLPFKKAGLFKNLWKTHHLP